MQDLQYVFLRFCLYILYLLVLYVFGWGFISYKVVFVGLILGIVLSLYNLWNLVRKFEQFGQVLDEGKKFCLIGIVVRFVIVVFVVVIIIFYLKIFYIISVVVGLMMYYVVIIIDLVV